LREDRAALPRIRGACLIVEKRLAKNVDYDRMTILVGMVGSDGIVFAADQLMVRESESFLECDDRALIGKIHNVHRHGFVFAGVGDEATRQVEHAIVTAMDDATFDFANIQGSLGKITRSTVKAIKAKAEVDCPKAEDRWMVFDERLPRALLVAFYGPQVPARQLWSVGITDPPAVVPIVGCRINGGLGNPGRFFAEYYRAEDSIHTLKYIAAYTVLAANRFDAKMIGGLDVSVIDEAGFRFITAEEKADIRKGYGEFNAMIEAQLWTPELSAQKNRPPPIRE